MIDQVDNEFVGCPRVNSEDPVVEKVQRWLADQISQINERNIPKLQLINLEGVTCQGQHVMDSLSGVYVIGAGP